MILNRSFNLELSYNYNFNQYSQLFSEYILFVYIIISEKLTTTQAYVYE